MAATSSRPTPGEPPAVAAPGDLPPGAAPVGLVLVSHSAQLAEGAAELARAMAGAFRFERVTADVDAHETSCGELSTAATGTFVVMDRSEEPYSTEPNDQLGDTRAHERLSASETHRVDSDPSATKATRSISSKVRVSVRGTQATPSSGMQ